MIQSRGIGTLDINQILKKSIFIDSVHSKNNNEILKKYRPQKTGDDGDTIALFFSNKLKGIDFSLSKELDSINNLKLCRIKIICNQKYSANYKIILPQREFLFEINEIPVDNQKVISEFIEKQKKHYN